MEAIDEIKEIAIKRNLTAYEIANLTGLSEPGIRKILTGKTKNPNPATIKLVLENIKEPHVEVQNINEKINYSPDSRFPKNKGSELIPYHNVDFLAGNHVAFFDDVSNERPAYYMDVPEFYGCTAFRAYSDSMEPIISSGNILFGTKVKEWQHHLEYGQIYGIICNDGRKYLKYIKKYRENPDFFFLLESHNKHYDEFELPKDAIRSIWLIHGWLNKNT